jgi:hypothetical protein
MLVERTFRSASVVDQSQFLRSVSGNVLWNIDQTISLGTLESGVVRPVDNSFQYPAVGEVIRVTITPVGGDAGPVSGF